MLPDARHDSKPGRTRRHRPGSGPLVEISVQMHASTLEAVKRAVEHGAAAGQGEFVEAALIARLRQLRREKVYASYREAAADPAYVDEMNAIADPRSRPLVTYERSSL